MDFKDNDEFFSQKDHGESDATFSEEFYSPQELSSHDGDDNCSTEAYFAKNNSSDVHTYGDLPLQLQMIKLPRRTRSLYSRSEGSNSSAQSQKRNINQILSPNVSTPHKKAQKVTFEDDKAYSTHNELNDNQSLESNDNTSSFSNELIPERRRSARLMKSSKNNSNTEPTAIKKDFVQEKLEVLSTKENKKVNQSFPIFSRKNSKVKSKQTPKLTHQRQSSSPLLKRDISSSQTFSSIFPPRHRRSIDELTADNEGLRLLTPTEILFNNENQDPSDFGSNQVMGTFHSQNDSEQTSTQNSTDYFLPMADLLYENIELQNNEIDLLTVSDSEQQLKNKDKSWNYDENQTTSKSDSHIDKTFADIFSQNEMEVMILLLVNNCKEDDNTSDTLDSIQDMIKKYPYPTDSQTSNTSVLTHLSDKTNDSTSLSPPSSPTQPIHNKNLSRSSQLPPSSILLPPRTTYMHLPQRRSMNSQPQSSFSPLKTSSSNSSQSPLTGHHISSLMGITPHTTLERTRESYGARRLSDYTSRLNRLSFTTSIDNPSLNLTHHDGTHTSVQSHEIYSERLSSHTHKKLDHKKAVPLISLKSTLISTLADLRNSITPKLNSDCLDSSDIDFDIIRQWKSTQFNYELSLDGFKGIDVNKEEDTYGFNLSSTNHISTNHTIPSKTGTYFLYLIPIFDT